MLSSGNYLDVGPEIIKYLISIYFRKGTVLNSGKSRCIRAAAKKSYFLSGPATKGGGVRGVPLRKKELFFLIWLF